MLGRRGTRTDIDLLFLIEPTEGGAYASTEELCNQLARRGLRTEILHQDATRTFTQRAYRRFTNAEVKLGRPPLVEGWNRLIGRRLRPGQVPCRVPIWRAAILENGLRSFLARARPKAIVATALSRVAWRRIRQDADAFGIPLVFYLRGHTMLPHLALGAPADCLVVNSASLGDAVGELGFDAHVVRSVIDLSRYRVEPTREVALVINPIPVYGRDLALEIARLVPEIPFELRESHAMVATDRRALANGVGDLDNVTLLEQTDDVEALYGRTRVLVVPYPMGDLATNRPRIVAEAQISGIPVVGSSIPGLIESIGPGGSVVDPADPAAWADELRRLWTDDAYYEKLSAAALAHASRTELDPAHIAGEFIEALGSIVDR
ncbi:MAG: glycosyltransferase [Acidimicrobiia bacterium]|nr:glycosyltransferase [Acidimicrobiia bacterium]